MCKVIYLEEYRNKKAAKKKPIYKSNDWDELDELFREIHELPKSYKRAESNFDVEDEELARQYSDYYSDLVTDNEDFSNWVTKKIYL